MQKILNSPVVIGDSKIHGKGLILLHDVANGTNIGVAFVKRADTGVPDQDYEQTDIGRFVNHSKSPNTVLLQQKENYFLMTTCYLVQGTEITVNYKTIPWYEDEPKFK